MQNLTLYNHRENVLSCFRAWRIFFLFGNVLSQASKEQLKQWMMDNKVSDSLFRSVLPDNWSIADRSGAGGYGSRGITAVVWSKMRSPLIISVYLKQTKASFDERNKAIADIGKEIFTLYNG
ncbi:MAG: serine hydrolase [Desulfobacteraceae bacterium]|nr:serine hydrolase [Desulfobacteraceae bacterium]